MWVWVRISTCHSSYGFIKWASPENEMEVSFFDRKDYEAFKLDPEVSGQTSLDLCAKFTIMIVQTKWDV